MTASRPSWIRHLLPVSWIVLLGGLLLTSRAGSTPAVWNGFALAGMGTLEAAILFLVLRPRSYRYHTGRALLGLVLLIVLSIGWAAKAPLIASPGYTLHLLWLMSLLVISCVLLGFSLWQQLQARHDP